MPGRLQNKIAIVTGASSGIGRAVSLAFHKEGASVVCADLQPNSRVEGTDFAKRQGEDQISTHEAITKDGGKAIFVKVDVTKSGDVEAVVKRAVDEYGRLDIMVNNAGIAIEANDPKSIWEVPESTWDKTLAINAKGAFLGCKYASAQMIKQDPHPCGDRGWIINTASILGLVGTLHTASYCSSKHAVTGLTKSVAVDCAPYRIHCNAICPGYTATSMTSPIFDDDASKAQLLSMHPFRGLGQPEDLAKACVFLASEDNTWITGISLPVDGGYTAI